MKRSPLYIIMGALCLFGAQNAAARPLVLELYTSEGCSSCPPADRLLSSLAEDTSILALSFHVDYWDYLGWQDPMATKENTQRQRDYKILLKGDNIYTPQLIVDGMREVVGSRQQAVEQAIKQGKRDMVGVPMTLVSDKPNKRLRITVGEGKGSAFPLTATVWAVQYTPATTSTVKAGENNGRVLTHVNSVSKMMRLGTWEQDEANYTMTLGALSGDSIAILVQNETQGKIIGAATYTP